MIYLKCIILIKNTLIKYFANVIKLINHGCSTIRRFAIAHAQSKTKSMNHCTNWPCRHETCTASHLNKIYLCMLKIYLTITEIMVLYSLLFMQFVDSQYKPYFQTIICRNLLVAHLMELCGKRKGSSTSQTRTVKIRYYLINVEYL